MKYLIGLAALCMSTAAHAVPVLTVATQLVDGSPGDGQIKLSSNRDAYFRRYDLIKSEPCPVTSLTPLYSYVHLEDDCPTEPVVTPVLTEGSTGEWFARVNGVVWGLNNLGTLGTLQAAPAAFSEVGQKYAQKAMFVNGIDVVWPGGPIDILLSEYKEGGVLKQYANQYVAGNSAKFMTGAFNDAGVWTGTGDCLQMTHNVSFVNTKIQYATTLKNVCATTITDVRMGRTVDVDAGDTGSAGATNNKVVTLTKATATLKVNQAGTIIEMSTLDTRGRAVVGGFIVEAISQLPAPQSAGYSLTGNYNIGLVFTLGSLPSNASTTITYQFGK